jgi:preprotein translocase subunit YajC
MNFHLLAFDTPGGLGGWLSFAPLIFIFGVFYFLLIMPQQRRQKKWQHMLGELKNGDKVVTSGGLFGTIVGIEGDAVQLRIADQVKVKVLRSAVVSVTTADNRVKRKNKNIDCAISQCHEQEFKLETRRYGWHFAGFLYGILGLPKSLSGQGLLAAIGERIHLGLDLEGRNSLILQVQVNDAVNSTSDRAVDLLKDEMNRRKINYTDISSPTPPTIQTRSRSRVCLPISAQTWKVSSMTVFPSSIIGQGGEFPHPDHEAAKPERA